MNTIAPNPSKVNNSPNFGMKFLTDTETQKGIKVLKSLGTGKEYREFIKEMKGIVDGKVTLPIKGKVKIKSRLLFVHISFDSNSRYSGSKTVCVSISRDPYDSTIKLNYIYENHTPTPEATDSPIHNGAARVTISEDEVNGLAMTGTYWTDRKWTEGMNTAGRVAYRRVKKA